MLWTLFAVLLILWLLGIRISHQGGLVHVLLVLAVFVLIVKLVTGRSTL